MCASAKSPLTFPNTIDVDTEGVQKRVPMRHRFIVAPWTPSNTFDAATALSIDTTAAEALPGVFAVMVGAELPTAFCIIPWTPDEHVLAIDKVRYVGDGVAAVAACDEETAIRACDLIEVE